MRRLRRGPADLSVDSRSSQDQPSLERDRATWSLYGIFAVWGWFLYAFNPSVPLIADDLGLTAAVAGLHGTAMAAGAFGAGLLQTRVVGRFGRRGSVVLGAGLTAAGILLVVGVGALWATLGGVFAAGLGGTVLVNIGAVALTERHGPAGGAALTEANGIGAFVGAGAPVALGVVVAIGWGWQPPLLLAVVGVILLAAVMPRLPEPANPPRGGDSRHLPRAYWWAWGTAVSLLAVEFSYTMWASTLVVERTGAPIETATSTITVLILALALGRLTGARLALRYSSALLLVASILVSAVGWGLLWTATQIPMVVVAMAISGVGMAFHFPLGSARALAASGGQTDLAAGRLALGIGLSVGAAPFVLGALSDAFGVVDAFWLIPGLLVLASALLYGGRVSAARLR